MNKIQDAIIKLNEWVVHNKRRWNINNDLNTHHIILIMIEKIPITPFMCKYFKFKKIISMREIYDSKDILLKIVEEGIKDLEIQIKNYYDKKDT